jgi:hypothetical protein
MSTRDDDDNIEFDFFDEPETVEATQRRRLPRLEMPGGRGGGERPPRPPLQTPTGLVPLARLVGLIAIAIAIVIGLVFWVGSCQGKSKHDEYKAYADQVAAIQTAEDALQKEFASQFLSATLKQSDLETKLQQYAQQEQQAYTQALRVRAPGPLRSIHQNVADAIELRVKGLTGLSDALAAIGTVKTAPAQTAAATKLAAQGELLTASDVVWEQLYRVPATQELHDRGVTGVVIPSSKFVPNPDTVSARAFTILLQHFSGTSATGSTSGKHGDQIVGTRVTPQNVDLSPSTPTRVNVSTDLTFVVTVEDSGDFAEVDVRVRLTITVGSTTIKRSRTITAIESAQQQSLKFSNFDLPPNAFGNPATVKVEVAPVPGEINTGNNTSTYQVFFNVP